MNTSNPLENMSQQIEKWRSKTNIVDECPVHAYQIIMPVRESSKLAHEAIKPSKEKHYKEILKAMKKINKPSTGKIIANNSTLNYHQVMRRLSEMRELGLIYEFGKSEEKFKPILWDLVENK